MITTLILPLFVCVVMIVYCIYQLKRNDAVYKIRNNWIKTRDPRHGTYSYDCMFDPNRINWFGLKFPKDEHFR